MEELLTQKTVRREVWKGDCGRGEALIFQCSLGDQCRTSEKNEAVHEV